MFSRISKKKKILLVFTFFGILSYMIINSSLEKIVKENIKFWVDDNIHYPEELLYCENANCEVKNFSSVKKLENVSTEIDDLKMNLEKFLLDIDLDTVVVGD